MSWLRHERSLFILEKEDWPGVGLSAFSISRARELSQALLGNLAALKRPRLQFKSACMLVASALPAPAEIDMFAEPKSLTLEKLAAKTAPKKVIQTMTG